MKCRTSASSRVDAIPRARVARCRCAAARRPARAPAFARARGDASVETDDIVVVVVVVVVVAVESDDARRGVSSAPGRRSRNQTADTMTTR